MSGEQDAAIGTASKGSLCGIEQHSQLSVWQQVQLQSTRPLLGDEQGTKRGRGILPGQLEDAGALLRCCLQQLGHLARRFLSKEPRYGPRAQ